MNVPELRERPVSTKASQNIQHAPGSVLVKALCPVVPCMGGGGGGGGGGVGAGGGGGGGGGTHGGVSPPPAAAPNVKRRFSGA